MTVWIALLRGINVGGRNSLKMKDFSALLETLGCEDVETYVQSGNAVFTSREKAASALAGKIGEAIEDARGFKPHVLVVSFADMKKAAAANPFPEAESEPRSLHLYFLDSAPKAPDMEKLKSLALKSERYALIGKAFYLHAPAGFGDSKLAKGAEKALGGSTTARNWRSVDAILELAARKAEKG